MLYIYCAPAGTGTEDPERSAARRPEAPGGRWSFSGILL